MSRRLSRPSFRTAAIAAVPLAAIAVLTPTIANAVDGGTGATYKGCLLETGVLGAVVVGAETSLLCDPLLGEVITWNEQGLAGEAGKSAYELASLAGFEGDETAWLASLKGEPGEKGDKGDKGDPGTPGTNGTNGADGAKGDKGDKGDPGTPGTNGTNGADGAKGDKGDKGDTGAVGPKGAKGDPGVSGYQVVKKSLKVLKQTTTVLSINCPTGKKPLGGGSAGGAGVFLNSSLPNPNGAGWQVRVTNGTAGDRTVTGYAVCAKVL